MFYKIPLYLFVDSGGVSFFYPQSPFKSPNPIFAGKKEIIFSLVGIERGLELLEKGVCGAALILIITGIGGAQQSLDRWNLCVCVCVCCVHAGGRHMEVRVESVKFFGDVDPFPFQIQAEAALICQPHPSSSK